MKQAFCGNGQNTSVAYYLLVVRMLGGELSNGEMIMHVCCEWVVHGISTTRLSQALTGPSAGVLYAMMNAPAPSAFSIGLAIGPLTPAAGPFSRRPNSWRLVYANSVILAFPSIADEPIKGKDNGVALCS